MFHYLCCNHLYHLLYLDLILFLVSITILFYEQMSLLQMFVLCCMIFWYRKWKWTLFLFFTFLEIQVHVQVVLGCLISLVWPFLILKAMAREIFPKWLCKKWLLSGQVEVWPVMGLVRRGGGHWKVVEAKQCGPDNVELPPHQYG